jgi:hypothetical protein
MPCQLFSLISTQFHTYLPTPPPPRKRISRRCHARKPSIPVNRTFKRKALMYLSGVQKGFYDRGRKTKNKTKGWKSCKCPLNAVKIRVLIDLRKCLTLGFIPGSLAADPSARKQLVEGRAGPASLASCWTQTS